MDMPILTQAIDEFANEFAGGKKKGSTYTSLSDIR
jgi:hypothetical protein